MNFISSDYFIIDTRKVQGINPIMSIIENYNCWFIKLLIVTLSHFFTSGEKPMAK